MPEGLGKYLTLHGNNLHFLFIREDSGFDFVYLSNGLSKLYGLSKAEIWSYWFVQFYGFKFPYPVLIIWK